MANKYSRYQLQPYVSQYVDPGTTQINTMLRQRWEQNKAKHDHLQQLANSTQVGKGDQKWKDAAIDEIRSNFDDVIKTNNYENAGSVVSNAVNSFMANEPLKAAAQSYEWWKIGKETEFELQAQGKVLFNKVALKNEDGTLKRDEAGNPIWVDPFDLHESYVVNEETGETSVNIYKPQAQGQLNWQQQMDAIVSNIGSDPILLDRYNLTNADLDGYLMYGSQISEEKVQSISAMLMDNYMSSAEGIQQNRYFMEQAINPATGEHYTADQAYNKILGQLTSTAKKQVSATVDYREDKAYWKYLDMIANQGDPDGVAGSILDAPTIDAGVINNTNPITPIDVFGYGSHRGADKQGVLKDKHFNGSLNYEFETGPLEGVTLSEIFLKYDNVEDMQKDLQDHLNTYIQDYELALEDVGGNTQDLITHKWAKANQDVWFANLIFQNKEAYFAMENGERVFQNDKEFFESVGKGMEEIRNKVSTMRVLSNPYSEYIQESVINGTYDKQPWIYKTNGVFPKESKSKEEFIDHVAQDFKRGKRSGVNTSRVGYGNTKKAITKALNEDVDKNLVVSGFLPAGSRPGTYVMTLKVPAYEEYGNSAFSVTFEVPAVNEVSAIFSDIQEVTDNLSKGNFDYEGEVFMGNTFDDNMEVQTSSVANVDYIFDTDSNSWQVRSVVNIYGKEDLDLETGLPLRDNQGNITGSPQSTKTFVGNWLVDRLFEIGMQTLYESNHYEAFVTGQAEKGAVVPPNSGIFK